MQDRQALADHRIARARQPSGFLGRQARDVLPQCLDEQRLRELRQHSLAAELIAAYFLNQTPDRILQPLARRARPCVNLQHPRQARENGPA